MSEASVRGVVHLIEETKTYGQKGFRKRLVVLEQQQERFTNYIPVDFTRDQCDAVDEMNVGDDVEITYRLSGRKWQKDPSADVRYFLSAEATNFKVVGKQGAGGGAEDANDYFDQAASDDDPPF